MGRHSRDVRHETGTCADRRLLAGAARSRVAAGPAPRLCTLAADHDSELDAELPCTLLATCRAQDFSAVQAEADGNV